MQNRIPAALAALETAHHIRILYACESGSRAWGFPSPDSDYDVRFIYVHRAEWYLRLDEGPDTLHFPINDELDLGGWELRKTLRLLKNSNAALFEWLQSPIIYHEVPGFRAQLSPLLPVTFNLKAGLHHYLGQLRRGVEEDLTGHEVRLKRLFYALRSALAARWIRERQALPPMEFHPLRELLPENLQNIANDLLARKAISNEKTTVIQPAALAAFLAQEYAAGQAARDALPVRRDDTVNELLDRLLQEWVAVASQQ